MIAVQVTKEIHGISESHTYDYEQVELVGGRQTRGASIIFFRLQNPVKITKKKLGPCVTTNTGEKVYIQRNSSRSRQKWHIGKRGRGKKQTKK